MSRAAMVLIRWYQNSASRVLPNVCRFRPSCSQYAFEAIQRYGFVRGTWLGARRIVRCNPFCEGGYDPVP